MKLFAALIASLLSLSAAIAQPNKIMDCAATQVTDTSIFEESFSVEEYPEVEVTAIDAYIGASHFSILQGDKIEVLPTPSTSAKSVRITPKHGEYKVYVSSQFGIGSGGPVHSGKVVVEKQGWTKQIASLRCKN